MEIRDYNWGHDGVCVVNGSTVVTLRDGLAAFHQVDLLENGHYQEHNTMSSICPVVSETACLACQLFQGIFERPVAWHLK